MADAMTGSVSLAIPAQAMQAMKAMKAKKKRVTKDDFVRNKAGKLVSRKKSALGKKFDRVRGWREAVMKARAVMGMRGFVAMNGQTAQGKALYAKTRSFYSR